MRNKAVCLWMSLSVALSLAVLWSSGVGAQPQDPVRATITVTDDGISIDEDTIRADRGRSLQYDVVNNTSQERTVSLTNFRIGTVSDGECVHGDEASEPLAGRLSDGVSGSGRGRIRVAVKGNAETGCYKYDIEATGLETLDPRLDIGN